MTTTDQSTKTSEFASVAPSAVTLHSNPVPCLVVSHDGPILVASPKKRVEAETILIGSRFPHQFLSKRRAFTVVYLDTVWRGRLSTSTGEEVVDPLNARIEIAIRDAVDDWSSDAEREVRERLFGEGRLINELHRRLIDSRSSLDLSAQDLARIADRSVPSAVRSFKNDTGMTLQSSKLWRRCRHAIRLVKQGETLQSACLDAGFYDPPHFCRYFKSSFGVTPTEGLSP